MLLAVACLIPWRRLPAPVADQKAALAEFPPELLQRVKELNRATKMLARVGKLVGLPINLFIGLTPVGSVAIGWLAAPFGGSRVAQVIVGAFALMVVGLIVGTPFGVWGHIISRRFGLTSQKWKAWTVDQLKGLAVSTVLSTIILAIIYGAMGLLPNWWWLVTLGLVTAFAIGFAYLYPVVIAPIFNKYTPMPDGSLRDRLLELAARDNVKVRDVMVADQSRRTNTSNAAVMGFGRTRKILIFDNMLHPPVQGPMESPPRAATEDEIACIIGHELAHAKYRDVLVGAFVGMVQLCLMFCVLFMLNNWHWLLHWVRVSSITDGRALALVLTIMGSWNMLFDPLNSLLKRRIEAAGDWHSLVLVRDPKAMESAWRWLVTTCLADPNPGWFEYVMYASHPSIIKRIAMTRAFARQTSGHEAIPAATP
jgi:STE24 endopeptidase